MFLPTWIPWWIGFLQPASKLQRMMEACSIVIMAVFTAWCVINNVEPTVTEQDQARRDADVIAVQYEARCSIYTLAEMGSWPSKPWTKAKNMWGSNPGCGALGQNFLHFFTKGYPDGGGRSPAVFWWNNDRPAVALYQEWWKERERHYEREWDKKEKAELAKADAAFEAALVKADESERFQLVLIETAKRTVGWWVGGLVVIAMIVGCIYGWLRMINHRFITHCGVWAGGDCLAEVVIPRYPFGRPKITGRFDKAWRAVVNFRGQTVLADRLGNRVVIGENGTSTTINMILHPSLPAYLKAVVNQSSTQAVTIRQQGEQIAQLEAAAQKQKQWIDWYRDEIRARNRLLVLAIEGMRKSKDFQRLGVVQTMRERLLERMREELKDDKELWAAIGEREEEEGLSVKPPTEDN